jgi:hypothetical protein
MLGLMEVNKPIPTERRLEVELSLPPGESISLLTTSIAPRRRRKDS